MIDPNKSATLDQQAAGIAELWSTLNWALYRTHQAKGFNEDRAFELTREYMACMIYRAAENPAMPPRDEEE